GSFFLRPHAWPSPCTRYGPSGGSPEPEGSSIHTLWTVRRTSRGDVAGTHKGPGPITDLEPLQRVYTLRQGDPSGPCGDHDHRVCGQNPPQGLQHRLQGLLLRCRTLPRGHLPVRHVSDHQVGPHRTGQLEHVREYGLVRQIAAPCRQPFGKFPGRYCALHEGRSTEVTRRATQLLLPSHQPFGGQQLHIACGQCHRVVVHVRGTHVLQPVPVQQPQHGHQIAAPATRVPQPYPSPASVPGARQR